MKINGHNVRRVNALWRQGDPSRDVDRDGKPVDSNYIVIVRRKDCRTYDCVDSECIKHYAREHQHIDPKDAKQAVRLAYGGTCYGYTEWKRVKHPLCGKLAGKETEEFFPYSWVCEVYYVCDGQVYKAIHRDVEPPLSARERLLRNNGVLVGRGKVLGDKP